MSKRFPIRGIAVGPGGRGTEFRREHRKIRCATTKVHRTADATLIPEALYRWLMKSGMVCDINCCRNTGRSIGGRLMDTPYILIQVSKP